MILFGVQFEAWHLFAMAGIVLAILEIFVPGFILLPIGISALISAVFAAFVADTVAQLAFFATMTIIMFFAVRPLFYKKAANELRTNADSLVGEIAVVIEAIAADQSAGYVKLYGDEWNAVSASGEAIELHTRVRITSVKGNKVVVEPVIGDAQ